MGRVVFVLAVIWVISALILCSGAIAQDPNDPGEFDTLYFTPGTMHSPTGDTLYVWPDTFPQDVILYVNFWNDNPIVTIVTPFTDPCNGPPCDADLDPSKNYGSEELPKCFEGSRVEHWDVLVVKVGYYPPTLPIGTVASSADPVPPGDGLFATFVFTVFDTGRICLDSCFYPPSSVLQFVDTQANGYVPVFKKRTFVVANCGYNCGDPNNDGITNIVDVVCLVNYVLRSGTPLCYEKSGDMNCDGSVDIVDITYLINYLFKGGSPPGYCP